MLVAASATLVDEGFAGTSASVVCKRAGLSHGALFGRFKSMNELLEATAEQCLNQQLARLSTELGSSRAAHPPRSDKPPKPGKSQKPDKPSAVAQGDRVDAVIRALWKTIARPEGVAVVELRLGARRDSDLRKRLSKPLRSWERSIQEALEEAYPDLTSLPAWPATMRRVLDLLQAQAISRLLERNSASEELVLRAVGDVARASLGKGK